MNTRQQDIVSLLETHGEVTIKSLAERLCVTEMTIRRDLDYLQNEGFLYKKRGAAVFVNAPDRAERTFYADEKRRIARKAIEFIHPGQTVLFDNSTTAREAAGFINAIPRLTVCATSLEVASIVAREKDIVLYCSGGYYFSDSKGFVGPQAEAFVERLHADICIIGASGVSIKVGLTNPYPMHTALQRKIIEAAAFRLLLADHSKFGKVAMEKAADLSEIDAVITDSGLDTATAEEYGRHTRLIIV